MRKKKSILKRTMLFFLICFSVFALATIGTCALIYNAQTLLPEKLITTAQTAVVYSDNGTLINDATEFHSTSIDTVPEHTRWAFICTEDKNFYTHNGFSVPRIIKAGLNNLSSGYAKEGASTITQQLIKNTHLSHEKTLQRKIREVALAHKLEQRYSKSQILEMYFNAIYFGNGIYGLESAANFYFSKPTAELTIRESAGLAGLIRSPARYCPISNYDNFCTRSDLVLQLMHDQKRITDEEYEAAKSQTPIITASTSPRIKSGAASYKSAAISEAANILNLSYADVSRYGYKVYTYFDDEIQQTIDKTVNAEDYKIKTVSGEDADKCIIAAQLGGEIVGYYTSTPTLRNAKRNFASALKPLVVYAPALELGVVTPATVIADEPYTAADFNPRNHDGKYHGDVTVRQALEQSYNIPAVKILDYTRLDRAREIASNLGLNLSDDENISVALGNTKNGTTFNEMIAGYCTLASNGEKANPTFIKKVTDKNGRTVYQNEKPHLRVIGEDTAYLVKDMLRSGTKTGTARSLESLPFDISAKTGTNERVNSDGTNTDAVNCSLTSDYVLLVWTGNADMKPENDLPRGTTGGGITSYIARDIQSQINSNSKKFARPESIGQNDTTKEIYALRYKALHDSHTNDFLKPIMPILDGRISGTGAPIIYFTTQAHQIYEIFKNNSLQEIIRNHSGEYIYTDTHAAKGKAYDYHVITYLKNSDATASPEKLQSNSVKLYTSSDINKKSATTKPQKSANSKQWFF